MGCFVHVSFEILGFLALRKVFFQTSGKNTHCKTSKVEKT